MYRVNMKSIRIMQYITDSSIFSRFYYRFIIFVTMSLIQDVTVNSILMIWSGQV